VSLQEDYNINKWKWHENYQFQLRKQVHNEVAWGDGMQKHLAADWEINSNHKTWRRRKELRYCGVKRTFCNWTPNLITFRENESKNIYNVSMFEFDTRFHFYTTQTFGNLLKFCLWKMNLGNSEQRSSTWGPRRHLRSRRKHLTADLTKHRNCLNLEPALILTLTKIRPPIEVLTYQKQAQSSH
jgi:hypothetical protein